jgi:hypothetical protein
MQQWAILTAIHPHFEPGPAQNFIGFGRRTLTEFSSAPGAPQFRGSLVHEMNFVFLRNGRYAAHVGLWFRPPLGCFGEESLESRGSDIDEHADREWRIYEKSLF